MQKWRDMIPDPAGAGSSQALTAHTAQTPTHPAPEHRSKRAETWVCLADIWMRPEGEGSFSWAVWEKRYGGRRDTV